MLCSRPNLCRGSVLKAMMPENKDTHTDVPKNEAHDSKWMLRAVLALVEGLPLGGGATAVHTGVAAAAREMVASETQGEAHAALLAFLAAIKEQPDLLHFYLTELLPDVAASFKTGGAAS